MRLSRTVITAGLIASLGLASAHAARPGAYSVTETDSATPGKGKTEVRCLRPQQVDAQGFLVPRQTLAAHESCKVTPGRTDATVAQWSAACAGELRLGVQQQNTGDDFQLSVSVKTDENHVANAMIKAQALGRACTRIDPAF